MAGILFSLSLVQLLCCYTRATYFVEMRDGIRLATDVYLPDEGGRLPIVLLRTPYNKNTTVDPSIAWLICDLYKYGLVVQDTRGCYSSEGIDSVFVDDGWGSKQDGYDTVEWIATQDFCNRRIGTFGGSALGIVQYMMAGSVPPHLVCQMPLVAFSNPYTQAMFEGGEFRKEMVEGWIQGQGSTWMLPFYESHACYDSVWERSNPETRHPLIRVPAYHIGGWYDIFSEGTINSFCGIQYRGDEGGFGNQKLLIGPWTHVGFGQRQQGQLYYPANARFDINVELFKWFGYWLKEMENGVMEELPVRFYLMGDTDEQDTSYFNRWYERSDWPPPAETVFFYLHPDKTLDTVPPGDAQSFDTYLCDPQNPVPTLGGRNLNLPAGPFDQRVIEARPDLLTYSTDYLKEAVCVIGKVTMRLFASSSATDTDWSVRLCDVYPDGRSMLVTEGMLKARHRESFSYEKLLVPSEIYEFEIDLWSTAIVFNRMHRIRVDIASSNYPRFEVNPNTGAPFMRNPTVTSIAENRVYHDALRRSALILPTVNREGLFAQVCSRGEEKNSLPVISYPNPFSLRTELRFSLKEDCPVKLSIYNILGQHIVDIINETVPAGSHEVGWDGRDTVGSLLPNGIYYYSFHDGTKTIRGNLVLIRR